MPFEVQITGIAEVQKMLREAPKLIVANAFHRALVAADNVIQAELAIREPHGQLTADNKATLAESRTSLIELDSQFRGGVLNIGYGKQGFVAGWVEFGHKMVGHKPGLKLLGTVVPHAFMRPSFDASADKAIEAFANALQKELA